MNANGKQPNRQGLTWINGRYLLLMSGRVVKPSTRCVHCRDCFAQSLIIKKRFRNQYGYVCPAEQCPGSVRFDRLVGEVPFVNQQGLWVAFKAALRNEYVW